MNTVNIRILFFGSLRAYFGDQMQMQVTHGLEIGDVMEILKTKSPDASDVLASCRVAVDSELEQCDFKLNQPHELAILPPFSGG
jgi:molybdopterin converting factor small subunit